MLHILSLLILAFALSLDGFGVGATYGLRKIKIPLMSVCIIACCSGVVIFIAMQIGLVVARFLSPLIASKIGGVILIGIGIWTIVRLMRSKEQDEDGNSLAKPGKGHERQAEAPLSVPAGTEEPLPVKKTVINIELRNIGLVIQISRKPSMADMDNSGNISSYEAGLLGLSLSMDAFGAGIGAALIGFSPWLTALVIAVACGIFVSLGLRVGLLFADLAWLQRLTFLPGVVLILIGIFKLWK